MGWTPCNTKSNTENWLDLPVPAWPAVGTDGPRLSSPTEFNPATLKPNSTPSTKECKCGWERPASNSCLTDPTRPDLPDTTTTSKSSAEAAATPASATTIVPTKCPSQPAAALSQESLPTNWVTPSVFTTNNADLTVTTTSKSSLATFLAT